MFQDHSGAAPRPCFVVRRRVRRSIPASAARHVAALACAVPLWACGRTLMLPDPPAALVPEVDSFAPGHGLAGTRVRMHGRALGRHTGEVEVRFGLSSAVRPLSVSEAGDEIHALVPEDATTGTVSVTVTRAGTQAFRAASDRDFVFDGAGHPRFGRVATGAADLRPRLDVAFRQHGTTFALDRSFYGGLSVGGEPVDPAAVAAVPAGPDQVAILDADQAGCGGTLRMVATQDWVEAVSSTRLEPAAPPCGAPVAVAVGGEARRVVVVSRHAAWVVDLDADPPRAERVDSDTDAAWSRVAWAGGERYLIGQGGFLRPLVRDEEGSPWRLQPAIDAHVNLLLVPGTAGSAAGIAAAPGRLAAVAGLFDTLWLFDLSVWPPEPLQQLPGFGLVSMTVPSLAFSDDAERLQVSSRDGNRVVTYDLTAPGRPPLYSEELEEPGAVVPGTGGVAYVAMRGGVWALSQRSGAVLGRFDIRADLTEPRLRRLGAGSEVVIGSRRFGRLVRLDPSTLEVRALSVPLDAPPIDSIESSTASEEVFVLHFGDDASELRRANGENLAESVYDRFVMPADKGWVGAFWLGDGGGPAMLAYTDADYARRLLLLDPTREWSPGMDAVPLPTSLENVSAALAADGRLVLVGDAVRVVDLAAAMRGEEAPVGEDRQVESLWAPRVAAGRLFLVTPEDVRVMELATGALLGIEALAPALAEGVSVTSAFWVAPNGRELWNLSDPLYGNARFVAQAIDPDGGAPGPLKAPVVLPGGADELLALPGGEHVVVRDGDRLVLLE